ncbi:conserved hypothetical protein [Leishmania major strain Friedlin]|uniref:Uncharacterized protein n=1 Tax=Leishmania major TaxID=5664 RepID=Q4Q987_LEIMA|nr:conserved hypothetical protein [Leishmania major strain Friedlin]CAG9576428.1 hypothetical_protein_-_conserved [Leishmania major strain Friedlin]CAJ05084.1 conserved hypothetical protein [Leishmania major strain Friedlin]|eukprot:XP_001684111.1 conserved hypothetical protein [Leishmania major strain Friedlin]
MSPAVSPSSKKHASPPKPSGKQGVFRSHPRGGSQLSSFSSPPSPSPAMTVGDMHGAVAPPRTSCTTEEKERSLLRYFSRGRCLYDTVPLQSASFALQRASCTQAQRVPLVTLFPAPSPSESAASLSTSAAACPTAESPGLIGVQSSASRPVGKSVTTAEGPAPVAPPTASSPLSCNLSSDLFSSYELQEGQHSDRLQFRLLSARFSSASDSNKFFGAAEMPLRDVCADMAEIWDTMCTTWEDAMRAWSGPPCSGAAGFSRRHSACFLVCYVQTQQKVAVGMSVQRIAAQVCELARANYAPQLFRVVPIFIGLRAQVTLCMDATACSSLAADVAPMVDARRTETVTYATGGLYTLAETVQCITRLGPHALDPRGSSDASPHVGSSRAAPELLCTLEPQVFLLSDSWLHVRSVADLYGDDSLSNSASDSRSASAAAPPASEQGQNRHARRATSFVPESTRRNVHVVPAVVADRLSRIEERAIARYIWCNMQRRVSDRRTAETLQPLHPSSFAKPL